MAPDWLRQLASPEWIERYGKPVEQSRLPDNNQKRYAYAEQMGADGLHLLHAIYEDPDYQWLSKLPSIETLRQTWVHQFYRDETGHVRWRQPKDLPPARLRTDSISPPIPSGSEGLRSSSAYCSLARGDAQAEECAVQE